MRARANGILCYKRAYLALFARGVNRRRPTRRAWRQRETRDVVVIIIA